MDVVGASSYSPVLLNTLPPWVEVGDSIPAGCDCVLEPDILEQIGPIIQVVAEVAPGTGIRRSGEEAARGSDLIHAGQKISHLDMRTARVVGLEHLTVRQPRVRVINVPAKDGQSSTARFIADATRAAGADVLYVESIAQDIESIATVLDVNRCDLVLTIGGTGRGRADATADAILKKGTLVAHGLAIQPGRTGVVGQIEGCPVIALPGSGDQALAVWLALVLPVLNRLSGRSLYESKRPLARKIASAPGVADVVLLKADGDSWLPISTGDLSLHQLAQADAWLIVPGEAEGYAAGTLCGAFLLFDLM